MSKQKTNYSANDFEIIPRKRGNKKKDNPSTYAPSSENTSVNRDWAFDPKEVDAESLDEEETRERVAEKNPMTAATGVRILKKSDAKKKNLIDKEERIKLAKQQAATENKCGCCTIS